MVEEETRDLISCNDLDSVFRRVGHRIRAVLFYMKKTGCGLGWTQTFCLSESLEILP